MIVVVCVFRLGEEYVCVCVCVGGGGGPGAVIICIVDLFLNPVCLFIIISLNDFDVGLMFFFSFLFFLLLRLMNLQ